jgi:hypothetical protein
MRTATRRNFLILPFCVLGLTYWSVAGLAGELAAGPSMTQGSSVSRGAGPGASPSPASPARPHRDHKPKHGGMFFMSLNNIHHLEGTLLPPATFRLYIYDAYTLPLDPAKVKEASGTVQWGDSAGAPETPLVLSKDGRTLEASLGQEAKFPITLKLQLHLPDSRPEAKPEVFKIPFSRYSGSPPPAAPHPEMTSHTY